MLKKIFGLLVKQPQKQLQGCICNDAAPQVIELKIKQQSVTGQECNPPSSFPLASFISAQSGLAALDWEKVHEWIEHEVPLTLQAQAWTQCERGWLLHLRDKLGPTYYLIEDDSTFVLSSLEQRLADVALAFIGRARKRILGTLQGLADCGDFGKDILVVCADTEDYFRYIAQYYPEEQEIVRSSGVFLSEGCGHFVTMDADLTFMEPVIIHELTHSYLMHLSIPTWLNEGIAVNVEHRLAGQQRGEFTPMQMMVKHQDYWTASTIQAFWSGKAFHIQDSSMLAYDLATNMVTHLAKNWAIFTQFALNAHWEDAGAQAAQQELGISLGEYVCLMLDKAYDANWEPLTPSQ